MSRNNNNNNNNIGSNLINSTIIKNTTSKFISKLEKCKEQKTGAKIALVLNDIGIIDESYYMILSSLLTQSLDYVTNHLKKSTTDQLKLAQLAVNTKFTANDGVSGEFISLLGMLRDNEINGKEKLLEITDILLLFISTIRDRIESLDNHSSENIDDIIKNSLAPLFEAFSDTANNALLIGMGRN